MNEEVLIVLEDGCFLSMHTADTDVYADGCDAAIDYTLYDEVYEKKDGGQMDYRSEEKGYQSVMDAVLDVIRFALDLPESMVLKYYVI